MSAVMKQERYDLTLIEHSNKVMAELFAESPTLEDMEEIQQFMATPEYLDRIELEAEHTFAGDMYIRELRIPAGNLVFGKKHAKPHLLILTEGHAHVVTEDGVYEVYAPACFEGKKDSKRAVYAYTDCAFITVHPTKLTTVEEIEADAIQKEDLT